MLRFSIVAVVVLLGDGLGCKGVVVSPKNSPVDAVKSIHSDAGDGIDSFTDLRTDNIRAVMFAITKSLDGVELDQWRLTTDKASTTSQLAWLAKDLGTSAFANASELDEAFLIVKTKDGPLHVGLLQVHFPNCKLLRTARAGVEKAKRLNFLLPVLTIFRTHERDHSLLFVLSETPLHKRVEHMLSDLNVVVGLPTPCVDSPDLGMPHR